MSNLILPSEGDLRIPEARTKSWVDQYMENRWLNLGDVSQIKTTNKFAKRDDYQIANPHVFLLDLMRKPENFGFTCKMLFGITLAPFQLAILKELWIRPFPLLIAARGSGKTYIMGLYSMLRLIFNQGSKIVIVGAGFRQAKYVFDYMKTIWDSSPILREIVGNLKESNNGPRQSTDRCTMKIGASIATALPIGTDGAKIRGQRANIILCDEFGSVNREVFETVIKGFTSVSLDPVKKYQHEMKQVALKELGLWNDEFKKLQDGDLTSNQTIISGTATYCWNHFYDYWKRYKTIIESRGNIKKMQDLNGGKLEAGLDYKDFCVIRIPIHSLPPRFMDAKSIAQAKATIHSGIYASEYGACFITDSQGFYKRSIIENCVVGKTDNPIFKACGEVKFNAVLTGNKNRKYVMAVDPASERDNFSIIILECWDDHRRIVYSWTTTKARFKKKLDKGLLTETNFYTYAARKIRDLMSVFPCERIAMDSQGGGYSILEQLEDAKNFHSYELPIYPIEDKDEPRPSDGKHGLHIVEIIQFSKADWVRDANHGMRRDFEQQELLFPEFDPVIVALSFEEDKEAGRIMISEEDNTIEQFYDTLEDCVMEIEDLKDELATIIHTQTGPTMRDHWDTPEIKSIGSKKGRLRKDRYSALLMANMIGRVMLRKDPETPYEIHGGFAHDLNSNIEKGKVGPLYTGPAWYTAGMDVYENYGAVVKKRKG